MAELSPPKALKLPVTEVLSRLRRAHGAQVDRVLDAPGSVADGPIGADDDPSWLTRTRMVGINVRTVGSFWRVVHYLLTVPRIYNAVHLLPIWEPGVVGSLYGMASWRLNDEFIDAELARECPRLDSPESQLAAVVSILHLDRRAVGMDVIPHVDRYSQIVLAQPDHFEWLRRRGVRIANHHARLADEVAQVIYDFVAARGPASPSEASSQGATPPGDPLADAATLFGPGTPEPLRESILFGRPEDRAGRNARREELISHLHRLGYEPVPATMGPPYRGIEVDPASSTVDAAGRRWYEYRFSRPQPMSRVFGPLTRYRFYGSRSANRDWEIDFSAPRKHVFDYLAGHVASERDRYGFDFMRGDMSHVQMRPEGVPVEPDDYYDPLSLVKDHVTRTRTSFAYFAEGFLAPPGVMAYGDEVDHLEASRAEVTLGDLQSVAVGDAEFLPRLRRYYDIADTRRVVPCFTVMTGDKDDPRFDAFYRDGNELRVFLSLFLPRLPSYTALGFELRDRRVRPAANEYYTKLYVFQERSGPKATHGPYRFGANRSLYRRIDAIRRFAVSINDAEGSEYSPDRPTRWLLPPDPTAGTRTIAWTASTAAGALLFVANTDTGGPAARLLVPLHTAGGSPAAPEVRLLFSTHEGDVAAAGAMGAAAGAAAPAATGCRVLVESLRPGEGRVYRVGAGQETLR